MGKKAKLFLNGEKLKVEGAQSQCSPQEGNGAKERETQPQSSPHKGNGAKENRKGIFLFVFFFFFLCKVCLCLVDLYVINFLFICIKFARCTRRGTTKQPISHYRGSNCARHEDERCRPSHKYS